MRRFFRVLAVMAASSIAITGAMATAPVQASPKGDSARAAASVSESPAHVHEIDGRRLDDGVTVFSGENAELTVLPAVSDQLDYATGNELAASISCSLNVHNVHQSFHYPDTINGVATIECTGNAGSLALHYSMIRVSPSNRQWGAPSVSNAGARSINNNRAISCSEGAANFQGWAQGQITPPPGYQLVGPPTHERWGNTTYVICKDSSEETGADSQLAERITVTFVRDDLAG